MASFLDPAVQGEIDVPELFGEQGAVAKRNLRGDDGNETQNGPFWRMFKPAGDSGPVSSWGNYRSDHRLAAAPLEVHRSAARYHPVMTTDQEFSPRNSGSSVGMRLPDAVTGALGEEAALLTINRRTELVADRPAPSQ